MASLDFNSREITCVYYVGGDVSVESSRLLIYRAVYTTLLGVETGALYDVGPNINEVTPSFLHSHHSQLM